MKNIINKFIKITTLLLIAIASVLVVVPLKVMNDEDESFKTSQHNFKETDDRRGFSWNTYTNDDWERKLDMYVALGKSDAFDTVLDMNKKPDFFPLLSPTLSDEPYEEELINPELDASLNINVSDEAGKVYNTGIKDLKWDEKTKAYRIEDDDAFSNSPIPTTPGFTKSYVFEIKLNELTYIDLYTAGSLAIQEDQLYNILDGQFGIYGVKFSTVILDSPSAFNMKNISFDYSYNLKAEGGNSVLWYNLTDGEASGEYQQVIDLQKIIDNPDIYTGESTTNVHFPEPPTPLLTLIIEYTLMVIILLAILYVLFLLIIKPVIYRSRLHIYADVDSVINKGETISYKINNLNHKKNFNEKEINKIKFYASNHEIEAGNITWDDISKTLSVSVKEMNNKNTVLLLAATKYDMFSISIKKGKFIKLHSDKKERVKKLLQNPEQFDKVFNN